MNTPAKKPWIRHLKIPAWAVLYLGTIQFVLFVVQSPSWLNEVLNWQLLIAGLACTVAWTYRAKFIQRCGKMGRLIVYAGFTIAIIGVGVLTVDAVTRAIPREIQKENVVPEQDVVQTGRSLAGVKFTNKSLAHAKFDGATLTDVSFRDSRLVQASFAGATLRRVDFSGANLCGSDFRGADLRQIGKFEEMLSVQFLVFDQETQFPEGFDPYQVPGMTEYRDRSILISCSPGTTHLVH